MVQSMLTSLLMLTVRQTLGFVQYILQEDVHDMLCALLLPTKTTAAKLFKFFNDYISGKLNGSF